MVIIGILGINALVPKSIQKNTTIPDNQQECESLGGKWGRPGIALNESCNLPTSDGGKWCTDMRQCEGACLAENEDSIFGKCTSWKMTVGCVNEMNDGRVWGTKCLD